MSSTGWPLCCVAGAGLSLLDGRAMVLTAVFGLLAGRLAARAAPALVSFGGLLVAAGVLLAVPARGGFGSRLVDVALLAAFLPWLVGRVWRQSRELVWAGWERAERLATETRLRERASIAQDMHDVLGHELNLIALRAGALKVAPGLSDEHRAAAGELRASAAAAVERLGEVVGLLGEPEATVPPSLEDLVERATASGLTACLRVEGDRNAAPAIVERVLRRVVQECLTNVAKHAPSTAAEVAVSYQEDSVNVRVRNEPVGQQSVGGGRGLAGLRERVRLLGGVLEHGLRDGGFEVVGRVPYTAPSAVPAGGAAVAAPVRQARRRFRRDLVVAVGLPVAALVLLAGGLKGWGAYLTAQSVLPASTYAGLRVGQDRASVERILPAREAPDRPPGSAECSYYAMTADPMDDRSGDLYELCWQAGVLASVAVVSP